MFKFLLLILIPVVLILGGLGYWRYVASNKPALTTPVQDVVPIEVPKTLPAATIEDRVKALEDLVTKLVSQVNTLKSQNTQSNSSGSSKVDSLDAQITELKVRIAALEKASPVSAATTSSNKFPIYIPLGSNTGPWNNTDWNTLSEYEALINPDNYPGYSSMQLEANFRLVDPVGTGSVKLYNVTDSTAISSQIDTTSTSFGLKSSSTFTLSSGAKTYKLQVKSTGGKDLYVQSARLRVSF